MTVYNWLSLIGVPTVVTLIVGAFWRKISARLDKYHREEDALRLGTQALLRDRLYQLARYCRDNGAVEARDLENFENLYKQYHALGANGVMDRVREEVMSLPVK